MSWLEPFDFAPSLHVHEHDDPDADGLAPLLHDPAYPHLLPLDKSVCSNFSCCGLALADLHQLLDHFEEQHVLVLGRNGRPLYPCPVPPSPPPHRPGASIILSYPQPDPPLPPAPPSNDVSLSPMFRALPDLDSSDDGSSGPGSPDLAEPLCLPPSLFTRTLRAGKHSNLDTEAGPVRRPRARTLASPLPESGISTRPRGLSASATSRETGRRRRDGREREFKCPHPGCSKQYLNPNGLKYHLEKGTCTPAGEP